MSKKGLDEKPESVYEPFFLHVQRQASFLPSAGSSKSSSSGGGFLDKLGFSQPRLEVEVAQDVLYVRPTLDEIPGEDELLKGAVTLFLPKPRKLKQLVARMIGRYDITWPAESGRSPPYENGVLNERSVSLIKEGEEVELEKGAHTFEFNFFVPANIACWERSIHGRVRYSLISSAVLSSSSPLTPSSEIASPSKTFFIVPNPGQADIPSPPPPLHLHAEGHFDDLGPWAVELQSPFITVGGLLLMRLVMPSPPEDLYLHSIKVTILQTFHLTSPRRSTSDATTLQTKPATHVIFIVDGPNLPNNAEMTDDGRGAQKRNLSRSAPPLRVVRTGEGATLTHLARLPNDNVLRPTTRVGTETPIRVEQRLEMEVLYREMAEGEKEGKGKTGEKDQKGKGKMKDGVELPELKKLRVSKPVELYSCLNFLDSLTLPRYEMDDPNPIAPGGYDVKLPCVCGMTLKEFVIFSSPLCRVPLIFICHLRLKRLLEKHASVLLSNLRSSSSSRSRQSADDSFRSSSLVLFSSSSPLPRNGPPDRHVEEDGEDPLSMDALAAAIKPDEERAALSPSVSVGVMRREKSELEGEAAGRSGEEGREGERAEVEWEWKDEKAEMGGVEAGRR
ncbi:hypothetical protein JCM8547_003697 [Rhodosporidiobolus lusitaniae]